MNDKVVARRITVRGLVQGVGFRPYVHRLATEARLRGSVRNTGGGVEIDLFGAASKIVDLMRRLPIEAPPLASIDYLQDESLDSVPPDSFSIDHSGGGDVRAAATPDAAMCEACRTDLHSPGDRRCGYPFLNCTHCGPRFSILNALPYDRANTTMAAFAMCTDCVAEYDDVADRRFHAQPVACPACGPTLWAERPGSIERIAQGSLAIDQAISCLQGGGVVALKGIGGFHLACDARSFDAIDRLRARKRRPTKPFALMVRDLDAAHKFATVSDVEAAALCAPAAPIVLLDRREDSDLPDNLAPGLRRLGVMLAYSPLHALLIDAIDAPLVMTSGNRSGVPQVTENNAARTMLADFADLFLMHDRAIANRVDDSLVQVTHGKVRPLRRARGLAPRPLRLPDGFGETHPQVLALGGDIKNAFGIAKSGSAVLSQHIGDLGDVTALTDLERTIGLYQQLYDLAPELIVADPHPGYYSTRLARDLASARNVPLVEVAHHHAHAAACMAEHGMHRDHPPVLALVQDGIGMGSDGSLWGAELLLCDYVQAERLASLRPAPLPGGDKAATEPWRNLLARLDHLGQPDAWPESLARQLSGKPTLPLLAAIKSGVNAPPASSAGRLFDAVACAIGEADGAQSFEGESAMRLQTLAETHIAQHGTPKGFVFSTSEQGELRLIDPAPLWSQIATEQAAGVSSEQIAARFHVGWADVWAETVEHAAARHEVNRIFLSGGVFQNRLFASMLRQRLERYGLRVHEHREVPANDGGLALGQIAIALALHSADKRN